jgi:hypothetical protein
MNEKLLRLVDDRKLDGLDIPGARLIPPAPEVEREVRDILLGSPPDRFSTLILLQRLEAHSDLSRMVEQKVGTYGPWLDQYGLWDPVEGILHGRILRRAREWPVSRRLTVQGPGPDLLISLGDRTWNVQTTEEGGLWYGSWPDELGLTGALQLDAETDRLVLDHRPIEIDWTDLYNRLKSRMSVQQLVQNAGLDRYLYQTPNPEEGVLAVTGALIDHNRDQVYV